ncbi:MAG: manganese-binding transcriptional regulator MntR [Phycisphaerae bacterium]
MATRSSKKRSARGVRTTTDGYRRTRCDHANELAEDYVELIDDLIRERGEARAVELARRLGVTQVTVTKAVERLKREGWVRSEPYRSIFLTAEGKKLADFTRLRHRTVLDFLLHLGVPRGAAEIDAEGIEHHISRKTLAAMRRFVKETSNRRNAKKSKDSP